MSNAAQPSNPYPPHTTPWYREPWPWLLMAGPAIVVVAGFATLGLAIQSSDGLVADDYYRQGKEINMTLHRDARAQELGYLAQIAVTGGGHVVVLSFAHATPASPQLRLLLHHPTRSGLDREVLLSRSVDGTYSGAIPTVEAVRWGMTLEDASREWRLTGDWLVGRDLIKLGGTVD
ncbi:MAG: FixH family protein [Betaproteobacteria bacterium]